MHCASAQTNNRNGKAPGGKPVSMLDRLKAGISEPSPVSTSSARSSRANSTGSKRDEYDVHDGDDDLDGFIYEDESTSEDEREDYVGFGRKGKKKRHSDDEGEEGASEVPPPPARSAAPEARQPAAGPPPPPLHAPPQQLQQLQQLRQQQQALPTAQVVLGGVDTPACGILLALPREKAAVRLC